MCWPVIPCQAGSQRILQLPVSTFNQPIAGGVVGGRHMMLGTPNLLIHPSTKASTAVVASRFFTGMASNHLVERSITVKMYLNPSGEVGSGPTKSA